MTTTATSASGSTRRPLVHQRQISFLALPPLLIPSVQPPSPLSTSTSTTSQSQAHYSTSASTSASASASASSSRPISTPPRPSSSILAPTPRPPAQGSLIAHLQQHQLNQQAQKRLYSSTPTMSAEEVPEIITRTRAAASGTPGEAVEPRQTLPTEDMEPNPANSIPLPPNRQKLVDDIIALYSCQPSIERVARYAPACVYDDQFVYANGEYFDGWKGKD
jgi:hypothetical protein